ncbi:MAG TPA: hypothetical protein VF988_14555 [Verrucomicrobiae bacterium]
MTCVALVLLSLKMEPGARAVWARRAAEAGLASGQQAQRQPLRQGQALQGEALQGKALQGKALRQPVGAVRAASTLSVARRWDRIRDVRFLCPHVL